MTPEQRLEMDKEFDIYTEKDKWMFDDDYYQLKQAEERNVELDDTAMKREMDELKRLYDNAKTQKDSFYKRRDQQINRKKSAGMKGDSPIWDDAD